MQPVVKPCKAEIRKGKNKSSMQSLQQADTVSSKGKCIYNPEYRNNLKYWDR